MYQAGGAQGSDAGAHGNTEGQQDAGSSKKNDDDVVDADYKEV
jgi:hypothetical protein